MTQQNEKNFWNYNIYRFCEKTNESDKIRDNCHLTGAYKRPAHNMCFFKIKQFQSKLITTIIHIFSNCDCHLVIKKS